MSRFNRLAGLCAGVSVLALMTTAACAPTRAAVQPIDAVQASGRSPANPPVVFAQSLSDLLPDPAARFGRLDNGMTYVIYKNGTPPGTASVWMRVGAGSAMEQEDQRGLAHFLEHMAFQGSTNVEEGEMLRILERDGLQFGADTNASTSFFETVYNLNLPVASERVVDQALFLMRETAGNLTLDAGAIDRERGVILSEERARATVGARAGEAELKALFPGTKYAERMPIGMVDVIRTAERDAFVRFYNDFYRPEYTTLIVAGDIDPERIDAEIKARFSDWNPGPQSADARTDFGIVSPRSAPQAEAFVAEGLVDTMSISWSMSPVDEVETREKSFQDTVFSIATAILNQRFARQAQSNDATFLAAAFQRQDIEHTARLHVLNIRPKEGQDRAAFLETMAMLRDYIANGPTQAELDRILAVAEQTTQERADGARTRHTQEIAGAILASIGSESVLQSPTQTLAEFEAWKPRITLYALKTAISAFDPSTPPLLWRQGDDATSFAKAEMLEAYRVALTAPVNAPAARASSVWTYTDFGQPSAITAREALPGLDATRVTFANGVVLTVKQTSLEDNTVHVAVQVGNGLMGIQPDQGVTLFMARQVGLGAGGLGRLRSEDIQEALAGKAYGMGFGIGDDASSLSGSTTPADLGVQLQVLAAFMTDPGVRPDALERAKAGLPAAFSQARTSPDGVYSLTARDDLYGGDRRFAAPSLDDALAIENDSIAALLKAQLGHGPVEVTIVGDITPDEAIRQVASTLGALPSLPEAVAAPAADQVRFPTTELHRVYTHDGRPDQNLSVVAWPTTDYYADPRKAAGLDLLAAVLTGRELEEIREKQGATYTVTASSNQSTNFPGFGFIISRASVRPEADEAFYETVANIVEALRQRPVTADELTRARQPLIEGLRNERNSNGYWLGILSGTIRNPRQIAVVEARERDLASVTAEEVQTLAQTYLDMGKALRIQVKPRDITAE